MAGNIDRPSIKDIKFDFHSLKLIKNAKLEASLGNADPKSIYQFERTGYFVLDSKDSSENNLIFNRAVSLRDSWARLNR